ncbi:homoserine dehydrogenase [Thermoplasma sp.]|uniref:homoserine dehydrogenase n=1 Tax=Thermoplasma sp. TaxID=1973142 RepID=UPI0012872F41|nr:homoserine dehydrogenase [Thermoplasma sp.]KAA8922829.1 MAG: homoserine dehydrogenase [Thermoplasma sp.]
MKETRIILIGTGNVGLNVLKIIQINNHRSSNGGIRVVGVSDSRSYVAGQDLDILHIIESKEKAGRLSNKDFSGPEDLLGEHADVLVDCTPASRDGIRESDLYRMAFESGMNVVTANKSGLANRWHDIMESARSNSKAIRYEATVAGGVPLFSVLDYSVLPSKISRFRGIVSSTINYVIRNMAAGRTLRDVVEEAINKGIAERNPQDDLMGLDAARKSVILVNHIFGTEYMLRDIKYTGVEEKAYGINDRLITEVYSDDGRPVAVSRIVSLPENDFLKGIGMDGLGYQITTDNNGTVNVGDVYDGPYETAGAVVNDIMLLSKFLK